MSGRDIVPFSIVITRAQSQSSNLMEQFAARGYYPVMMPSIGIDAVELTEPLMSDLQELKDGRYHWLIITSPNGVKCLDRLLKKAFQTNELPHGLQTAILGPQSAELFEQIFARKADLIPQRHNSEGLLGALRKKYRPGTRYFIGAARKTREVIMQGLRREGAEVKAVSIYETVPVPPSSDTIERLRKVPRNRLVFTFFSPSAVESTYNESEVVREMMTGALMATVGPVTTAAVKAHGFPVFFESRYQAEGQFIEGLTEALDARPAQAYEENPGS